MGEEPRPQQTALSETHGLTGPEYGGVRDLSPVPGFPPPFLIEKPTISRLVGPFPLAALTAAVRMDPVGRLRQGGRGQRELGTTLHQSFSRFPSTLLRLYFLAALNFPSSKAREGVAQLHLLLAPPLYRYMFFWGGKGKN